MFVRAEIKSGDIENAEKVLVENGVSPSEVDVVLQTLGYVLLDTELYPEYI